MPQYEYKDGKYTGRKFLSESEHKRKELEGGFFILLLPILVLVTILLPLWPYIYFIDWKKISDKDKAELKQKLVKSNPEWYRTREPEFDDFLFSRSFTWWFYRVSIMMILGLIAKILG